MTRRFLSFHETVKGPLLKYYRNNSNTYFTGNPLSPESGDSSLRLTAPEESRFGKIITEMQWSLGGFNGTEPQVANQNTYDFWLNSFYNHYGPGDFREDRPAGSYAYVNRQEAGRPVESFSRDMMAAALSTARTLISNGLVSVYLNEVELLRDGRTAAAFIGVLTRIPTPALQQFDYPTLTDPGLGLRTLNDLFDRMPSFTRDRNYLDNPRNLLLMSRAIRVALPPDVIQTILAVTLPEFQENPKYNYYFVSEQMPFVTSMETNPLLENDNMPQGFAQVNPDYARYDAKYEEATSLPDIPVGVQPDNYVFRLYSSASATPNEAAQQQGISVPTTWQNGEISAGISLYSRYRTILNLNGNIDNSHVENTRLIDYLSIFSDAVPTLTEEDKQRLSQTNMNIIVPSREMYLFQDTRQSFPFSIAVDFEADDVGPAGSLIQRNQVSIPIMQALKDSDYFAREHEVVSTYVNLPSAGEPRVNFTSKRVPLSMTSVTNLLDFGKGPDQDITSLILSHEGTPYVTGRSVDLNLQDDLSVSTRRGWVEIAHATFSRYSQILNAEERTTSEALCYRLTKKHDGNVVKDVFIGNGASNSPNGGRQLSYIDTQIKYDTMYEYELSEYRCVYSTNYHFFCLPTVPYWMLNGSEATPPINTDPEPVVFDIMVAATPSIKIIKVPIYSREAYSNFVSNPRNRARNNGLYFPTSKVLDFPPPPPELLVIPYMDNYRQIQIGIKRSTGDYTGRSSLPVVSIGDQNSRIASLYRYQKHFEYYGLQRGFLGYRNESTNEVRRATLYRTESMTNGASTYADLYSSFNPENNEDVKVRHYSIGPTEDDEVTQVESFDLMENLEPNREYFYTATVEDVHGNPSNPSPIYRVRLLYDKGLYIPEVDLYQFTPVKTHIPTRKFARFLHIEASDIQTFPFNEENEEGVLVGTRNLATNLGNTINGENFLVRLTSRDTGRKIDIKLSFSQRDINE